VDEKIDVSVLVLAKNEEESIVRCISSARFCREIIVVDSGSVDRTREVARKHGATVIETVWPGDYSVQRNRADSFAKSGWVFHLDADEWVDPGLAEEITLFFHSRMHEKYGAARIPRKEIIFGKWIRHGGWYPQYKLRLYRKESGSWKGRVHERFEAMGEVATFSSPIVHDSYKTIHLFLEKFNRYSTIDAEEEFAEGRRFSIVRMFFAPAERFFGRYVRHQGFRDGFHGFALASLIALNYFLRYLKLWEKHDSLSRQSREDGQQGDLP